ncbi:MAG: carbamoyl-phosphate synthase small subunit [Thermoplasmata archaeon HGW-Thermoplasmata-1]|nr:MAG: carbamoyl-phosphate synthase small subunit [Thermoplasmata archaeon HGW-Thermoplasmata-1]
MNEKALLVLEDGTCLQGKPLGEKTTVFGELVFNTSMTGYQESLTDPSYNGQILMFTYPLIGNYGISDDAFESERVWVRGCVVREACKHPSHRFSKGTLCEFLTENGTPGIAGPDTRALTIKTRQHGTLKGALSTDGRDAGELLEALRRMPHPCSANLMEATSCRKSILHEKPFSSAKRIALIDCGAKANILRELSRRFEVVRMPYDATVDKVMSYEPDGLFISNGPGDPSHPDVVEKTVKTLRGLCDELPTFGICMGHQLLSQVYGGGTYKMLFGHRGANQPVKDIETGRIYITSQNHGYAVDAKSLEGSEMRVSQVNPNDNTVEGMRHESLPVFSVQYHPEARPGPLDTIHLFDRFRKMVEGVDGHA